MLQPQSWGAHLRTSGFDTSGLQSLPPSVCQLLATADKVQGTALEPYFAMGNLCISTEMRSYRRLLVTEVLVSSDFESPLILLTLRPGPMDGRPWAGRLRAAPPQKQPIATLRNLLNKIFL